MVEVTKFNYETLLEEVFAAVRDADFVAIDTNVETTGFVMFDEVINPTIITKGWYDAILDKQTTRSPMDFGIAIFKKLQVEDSQESQEGESSEAFNTSAAPKKTRYTVRCYSIPICFAYVEEHDARSESRRLRKTEQRLDIDNIALEFIQRTKLDLNKVLYAGTPFMNRELQHEAINYMTDNPDFMTISGKHVTNGDIDRFYFPKLYEKVEQQEMNEIVSRLRGIGKFFDVTAETNKPIIGHNLLIKLLILYKDFVEYLPQQFPDFLVKLKNVLPQFYDTKFMAWEIAQRPGVSALKKSMVQSNDLFQLYRNVGWVGTSMLDFNLDKETETMYGDDLKDIMTLQVELEPEGFCHESGFDACVSGMVFAKLAYIVRNEDPNGPPFALDDEFFLNQCEIWKNKMFLQEEVKTNLEKVLLDSLEENMAKCSHN